MPFSVRNLLSSNATLRARRLSANFEIENPDGSMRQFTVQFYMDRWGRARLLEGQNLPSEVSRKYSGTLLHGLLSKMDYQVVRDSLGYRIRPKGQEEGVMEYEFTISLASGQEGIAFRERRFSGMREYGDLRNIGFSEELNGATISIRVHSEHADLRNSSYEELTHVFRSFRLYNRDGSETLAYSAPPSALKESLYTSYSYPENRWSFRPYLQFQQGISNRIRDYQKHLPSYRQETPLPLEEQPRYVPAESPFISGFSPMADVLQAEAFFDIPDARYKIPPRKKSSEKSGFGSEAAEETASSFKPVPFSALKSFKAAIFDLDGVAVDSEGAHLKSFNQLLAPLGIRITEEFWRKNYTGIGSYAIIEDVFRRNNIRKDAHEWVQRRAEAYHDLVVREGLKETEGFRQFFSMLAYAGVKQAIASGGHRPHVLVSMMAVGIPMVPFVGLEDVKNAKPSPEAFLLAAEKLGVKPQECIVFEDSLAGMKAAAAAGMPCVAIATTLPAKALEGKAALVVNNFSSPALRAQIAKLVPKTGSSKGRASLYPVKIRKKKKAKPRWLVRKRKASTAAAPKSARKPARKKKSSRRR